MSLEQQYSSWPVLGSTKLTANGSSSNIITIPACDLLRITVMVTGYQGGGGIASLRFGGTAGAVDSGNNYNTRHQESVAGSDRWDNNTQTNNTDMIRLGRANVNLGRIVTVNCYNVANLRKICKIETATERGGAGTTLLTATGIGQWANTTQQIISVQLVVSGGDLNSGSGFIIEGINL